MNHLLTKSIRVRQSPFTSKVEEAGVKAFTVYNRMLLPAVFESLADDAAHLKRAVQIWDVAGERQVEIIGPDATRLIQMSTPRDLARMKDDQCYYIPVVDHEGGMLNDPVALRLAEDRYWVSLADSDLLLYYKGLALGFGLDVKVFEPDVSPLAIQGPKSDALIARAFGEEVTKLRFFRHMPLQFEGADMVIARSGWSLQGGFEIYMNGSEHGPALWDCLFEAGKDLDVRAGCPNGVERIEGGLLSYGSDMDQSHTPFEAGLGKYVHASTKDHCLGTAALLAQGAHKREIRPVAIEGAPLLAAPVTRWPLMNKAGEPVGSISSCAYSESFKTNVAIGMVARAYWDAGTALQVQTPDDLRDAKIEEKFWAR